jgi:hypothetical protein
MTAAPHGALRAGAITSKARLASCTSPQRPPAVAVCSPAGLACAKATACRRRVFKRLRAAKSLGSAASHRSWHSPFLSAALLIC